MTEILQLKGEKDEYLRPSGIRVCSKRGVDSKGNEYDEIANILVYLKGESSDSTQLSKPYVLQ